MSHDDPIATAAPAPRPSPRPAAPRGGGSVALALLLALLALLGAGYIGWRQWQQARTGAANRQQLVELGHRLGALETALDRDAEERAALRQRAGDADQVNRGLREALLGQAERVRNLEDALARLAQKTQSGHDAMLLDETETLLRLGQQRYELFHDAQGAAAAYALADQSLAAVNDGAFSGVRQSIGAEREALLASAPRSLSENLAVVQRLREGVLSWPSRLLDRPAGDDTGAWSRLRRALADVIRVQRDDGTPLAMADARLGRSLVALDLAQAQADLLDHDEADAAAALRRVDAALTVQFDDGDAAVRAAHAHLGALLAALKPSPSLRLGGALAELRNLRAVHALQTEAAPAPAKPATGGTP